MFPGNISCVLFEPCSCDGTDICLQPLGFYCYSPSCVQTDSEPNNTVPGIYLGCQLLDFAYSSVRRLFSPSCIQMLTDERLYDYENLYLSVELGNITALSSEDMFYFIPEDLFQVLMEDAFINRWIDIADYKSYYTQCQPKICTYTVERKLHLISLINVVIGLSGGLTVLLRALIPFLFKIMHGVYRLVRHRTRGTKR
ncbi:unnamed protein product [Rotaria sp. Silwood2]|nr:unnamed protein product [Rotaria sp. Silwood2]CAF4239088.1 unnamed protein product [Rotaria sp. Silwood2]